MSAIAGLIRFDGSAPDRRIMARMAAALPGSRAEARIMAGPSAIFAVRPDVRTPEDRHDVQPISVGDEALVFDGRIDNRAELAAALTTGDCSTLADSAFAALAWRRWGRECLSRLSGSFALAHWDGTKRRLTLATSAPMGAPLFVHRRGSFLAFASAPQALFAHPDIPRELNDAALADILLRNRGGGESLFREIDAVPFAHWIEHRSDGTSGGRYWNPAPPDPGAGFDDERLLWEQAAALFGEVVASQLRAVDPIGVQISGGLDSALIAGQAASLMADRAERLRAYTRVPAPGASARPQRFTYDDERPRVEAIARMHSNLDAQFIHAGEEPLVDPRVGTPGRAYAILPAMMSLTSGYAPLWRRAAADGVRVMLVGGGGNLSLTWHGHPRFAELLRGGDLIGLLRELAGFRRAGGDWRGIVRTELIPVIAPHALGERVSRRARERDWAARSAISRSFAEESGATARIAARNPAHLAATQNAFTRRVETLSPTLQGFGDHILIAHGIERRRPMLDRRLVEFALALPDRYFLNQGIDRRLARRAFAHRIPEEVARSAARGRQDADWASRLERDVAAVEETLERFESDPDVASRIDVAKMRGLWRRFLDRHATPIPPTDLIELQQALLRGLEVGQFVRWFKGKN